MTGTAANLTDLLPVKEESLVENDDVRVRIDLDACGHDGGNVESLSGCGR